MSEDARVNGRIAAWENRHRVAVVRGLLVALLLVAAVVLSLVLHAPLSTRLNPADPGFSVGPISETASHQIVRLDSVADALAPSSGVVVNCWSQHDWTRLEAWLAARDAESVGLLGETFPETEQIQLSPFVCRLLAQAMTRPAQQQPLLTAFAVTVLAHESAHASGIRVENRAECRAVGTEPRAARLLGIPKGLALRLQHLYRGTAYYGHPPRYLTPRCKAGLPGVAVPDTLGTAGNLRPLKHTATAVARDVPGWRDIGGGLSVRPLSPCALVESRTSELARFGDAFLGPHGASVLYTGVRTRTPSEFATARRRYAAMPRCDLAELGRYLTGLQSTATVTRGRIPGSITRLSPQVHAFREIYTLHGETWNRDKILVFDPAERAYDEITVRAPARSFPASLEQHATKTMLLALHHG